MAKGAASGGGDRHLQASAAGMALIRLFLGGFFLYNAITKVMDANMFLHYLQNATAPGGSFVTMNTWPPFADFLVANIHPHADLFSWLVIAGELTVGATLVLGLLTRLAALGGLAMSALYLLATMHLSAAYLGVNAAFIAMEIAVIISAAGRTFGIDRAIAKRTRVKLLW